MSPLRQKTTFRVFFSASLVALSACSHAVKENDQWQSSTLPPETIEAIQGDIKRYQTCINREAVRVGEVDMDSRAATDLVMKACEPLLTETRRLFLEQDVPESIADRYLRRKRTQTARGVLFQMMQMSALRAGTASEAPKTPTP